MKRWIIVNLTVIFVLGSSAISFAGESVFNQRLQPVMPVLSITSEPQQEGQVSQPINPEEIKQLLQSFNPLVDQPYQIPYEGLAIPKGQAAQLYDALNTHKTNVFVKPDYGIIPFPQFPIGEEYRVIAYLNENKDVLHLSLVAKSGEQTSSAEFSIFGGNVIPKIVEKFKAVEDVINMIKPALGEAALKEKASEIIKGIYDGLQADIINILTDPKATYWVLGRSKSSN